MPYHSECRPMKNRPGGRRGTMATVRDLVSYLRGLVDVIFFGLCIG